MTFKTDVHSKTWRSFTPLERRNIIIYILGILLYKFGLEAFNGSVIALATNRYDQLGRSRGYSRTFERVGLLTGLNQACQCIGSILIAPLVKSYSTKNVLSYAILMFGVMSSILLILEAATGGSILPMKHSSSDALTHVELSHYGQYNTDGMILIYCLSGIAYGMVELIRRVIPRDIVGGNFEKLQRMDATVHIFYEISGILGPLITGLVLIPRLGNNFSFIVTPICFALAAVVWSFLREDKFQNTKVGFAPVGRQPTYIKAVLAGFKLFFISVWIGARTIFSHRKFIWLLPGYALALYAHRYLENTIALVIARRYLENSAWSLIIVSGSNLGELLGALFVFVLSKLIHTPIPWLRLDALMVLILWYLPFWYPPMDQIKYAWLVAASFVPISFGWAAGDISLSAYIQAALTRVDARSASHRQCQDPNSNPNVSSLGAVMAFLYCTHIVLYAIVSPIFGAHIDKISDEHNEDIHKAVFHMAGDQYTIIFIIMMVATFIPKGAFALNPKMLSGEDLAREVESELGSHREQSRSRGSAVEDDAVELKSPKSAHIRDYRSA